MKPSTVKKTFVLLFFFAWTVSIQASCPDSSSTCNQADSEPAITHATHMLGKFNLEKDLFLPQFDSKTDVDDIHSVAAVATMLKDPRFSSVKFHAVAGAYGIQEGLYVPANQLFDMAFGEDWSDAHGDHRKALKTVTALVIETLRNDGSVWVAEAGQSDFSATVARQVKALEPDLDIRSRFHIVQHSEWNQESTDAADLAWVKANTNYHKINDGNEAGNGTPGFRSSTNEYWQHATGRQISGPLWKEARDIGNRFNGVDGRYLNKDIKAGGMDFSDTSETCWIFGFDHIHDTAEFFRVFKETE